jgi:transcriptional regulator with XRE-family HTH domain
MTNFGQFIKTEREKQNLTQTEFGAMIGINSSAISRIENGTQPFSKEKLLKLSELFKIDLQVIKDLFFGDKFAKEAYKYKCSESVFTVAEDNIQYLINGNSHI